MNPKHLAVVGEGDRLLAWQGMLQGAGHQVVVIQPPLPVTTLHVRLSGVAGLVEISEKPMATRLERLKILSRAMAPDATIACVQSERTAGELSRSVEHPIVVIGDWLPIEPAGALEVALPEGLRGDARQRAIALLSDFGPTLEIVPDQVGLVFARTLALIINEAAFALQEGVASADDIDRAMKLGANYPEGPLEWAERIGLDRVNAVLAGLRRELGEDRYRIAPLLKRRALADLPLKGV